MADEPRVFERPLAERRAAQHWYHSLFVRFFFALISLSLIPSALIVVFTVAAYQVVLQDFVDPRVVSELSRNLATQAILVFLFITVIALFIAFLLSRSITRPLRILTSAVERITKGDIDLFFRVTRKDEIGTLGHFFNDMILRLREITDRQKAIGRVKSEFVSITAHQLRTPLSALKWSLRMFLDGDLGNVSPKAKEMIERSYQENERMIRLVNDLLDVARIEEGRFGYQFAPLELGGFLQGLVAQYALAAEERGLTITLTLPKQNHIVSADKERLALAVGNLIENAINYSLNGARIEVALAEEPPDFLLLSVRDHGVGVAKKDQKRLFTKFFRAANVVQMQTSGSGLGLFIVKNVIQQHGGRIWFESEEGRGTTFFMTLPIRSELVPDKEHAYEEFIEAF